MKHAFCTYCTVLGVVVFVIIISKRAGINKYSKKITEIQSLDQENNM